MSPGFYLKVFTELFSLYDLFSSDALRLSDLQGFDGATEPPTFILFPFSFIRFA
jgi:hypothetical protein